MKFHVRTHHKTPYPGNQFFLSTACQKQSKNFLNYKMEVRIQTPKAKGSVSQVIWVISLFSL